MDLLTAVGRCLLRSFRICGRARRAEFWWFALFAVLALLLAHLIETTMTAGPWLGPPGLLSLLLGAMLLPATISAAIRRLHDLGHDGRWLWITVVPVLGWVLLLWWFTTESEPRRNRYGPDPLDPEEPPQRLTR